MKIQKNGHNSSQGSREITKAFFIRIIMKMRTFIIIGIEIFVIFPVKRYTKRFPVILVVER